MERIDVDTVDPNFRSGVHQQPLSDPLATSDVAINRYRVEPGGRIAGLHAHGDQEEVFYVVDGRLTVETLDGAVAIESEAAVRFAPGEHKSAVNDGDDPVEVVALGAPRDSEEVTVPLACPACGHDELGIATAGRDADLVCPECEEGVAPRCPACGGADLAAVLDRDRQRPISECMDCGDRFALADM